jgi:hypothetical protein
MATFSDAIAAETAPRGDADDGGDDHRLGASAAGWNLADHGASPIKKECSFYDHRAIAPAACQE